LEIWKRVLCSDILTYEIDPDTIQIVRKLPVWKLSNLQALSQHL